MSCVFHDMKFQTQTEQHIKKSEGYSQCLTVVYLKLKRNLYVCLLVHTFTLQYLTSHLPSCPVLISSLPPPLISSPSSSPYIIDDLNGLRQCSTYWKPQRISNTSTQYTLNIRLKDRHRLVYSMLLTIIVLHNCLHTFP